MEENLTKLNLDLPKEFIERIGELKCFERSEGVMMNFREVELSLSDAEEYMWVLSSEILMSGVKICFYITGRGLQVGFEVEVGSERFLWNIPEISSFKCITSP